MVSEAAFIRGSQVLGIIPRVLKPLGSSSDSSTGEELVVSGDLATLEALMTLASWAHLHIHQKPIGLLNVEIVVGTILLLDYRDSATILALLLAVLVVVSIRASKLSDVDGDPKLMGTGKGLKAILGGLEELWDQSQYTEEYNLSQFLAKLNS
ncbi:hypothetical protein WN944_019548 [Citrus x changshan-huyou]|uniref:Uncharacterized protein n=1 Tax=Citrus x changshan-huyou TaxID=2935761 RepID=A0AAP0QGH0_9ROSI